MTREEMRREEVSEFDAVRQVLEDIVKVGRGGGKGAEGIGDDHRKVFGSIELAEFVSKTSLEVGDRVLCEARERSVEHERDDGDEAVHVLATGEESLRAALHEPLEGLGLDTAEHFDHLIGELEGRSLKPKVASGRDVKDEAKVNVHDVTIVVDQHVSVVAILDLQDVRHHAVRRHTAQIVVACLIVSSFSRFPSHCTG